MALGLATLTSFALAAFLLPLLGRTRAARREAAELARVARRSAWRATAFSRATPATRRRSPRRPRGV